VHAYKHALQEPHAKQVKELLQAQESSAKERARLEEQQKDVQSKRAELAAQVCLPTAMCGCAIHVIFASEVVASSLAVNVTIVHQELLWFKACSFSPSTVCVHVCFAFIWSCQAPFGNTTLQLHTPLFFLSSQEKAMAKRERGIEKEAAAVSKQASEAAKKRADLDTLDAEVSLNSIP
jgi:hypothetical protein